MIEKKKYDLEERTYTFAQQVRLFIQKLPRSSLLKDDISQLLRSSGSIGANYIEANESLGKKDFAMRIRICRKEAKETTYWLRLLVSNNLPIQLEQERAMLENEAIQLTHIFGSIITKVS